MNNKQCILCDKTDLKTLYKKDSFDILHCTHCGSIFNSNWDRLSDEQQFNNREVLEIERIKKRFESDKILYFDRFNQDLKKIIQYRNKGKLLDIGSSYGFFLTCARDQGWETIGIDVDINAVNFSTQHLNLDVKFGNLIQCHFDENKFDVITLFHVLEHVPNPHEIIQEIKRILKPDGLVVIDVPNADDFRRLLFKENWPQFREHHLWYFSIKTLRFFLQKYGFKVLGKTPHGGSQIGYALKKGLRINTEKFSAKHFKIVQPIKKIVLPILNKIGFSEDITVYAKNIDN